MSILLNPWPLVISKNTSSQRREPHMVLFGQWSSGRFHDLLATLDVAARWPRLEQFGGGMNYLVLARGYSMEQAMLFAEDVNRCLRDVPISPAHRRFAPDFALTWGIAPHTGNLKGALAAAVHQSQRACEEERFGSINLAEKVAPFDEPFVCARRDKFTDLWAWSGLVAWEVEDDELLSVLLSDIDRLRSLNDNHGFPSGDAAIQAVAHVLRSVQSVDIIAFRMGGSEFCVLARGFSLERARDLANEINERLSDIEFRVDYLDKPFRGVPLTWGVASSTKPNIEPMLRQADELLHAAKSENRRGTINS